MRLSINNISYFIKIHQQDERKPVLFLLHGFMGSGRVFEPLNEKLKTFCNPVTVDLLGHGKTSSASLPERFQTKKQVDDLTEIISRITDEPVYLHGYSMGGRLALQYALEKPNTLKGLILESAHPGLTDEKERAERKKLDERRANEIETDFYDFLNKWKKLPLFKNSTAAEKDLQLYDEIQCNQNRQQMAYSLRGFGTGRMPPAYKQLGKLDMPVLLLAGAKDEKYRRITADVHEQIPSNTFEVIPDAGHRVHLDQPQALSQSIYNFIKKTN